MCNVQSTMKQGAGIACWWSARFAIEMLQVLVPAGAARDFFFSPELTFCADSYLVSIPFHVTTIAHKRPWSFCQKCKGQAGYTWACIHPWPKRVGWICCPGIVWEPIREASSNAACQATLVHSHLSSLSHCGLILAEKVEMVHANWSQKINASGKWSVKSFPQVHISKEKQQHYLHHQQRTKVISGWNNTGHQLAGMTDSPLITHIITSCFSHWAFTAPSPVGRAELIIILTGFSGWSE